MKVVFQNPFRPFTKTGKATAAAILLAAVSYVSWTQWGFVRAEIAIRENRNGHLDDLAPLAEYLGSALDSKNYALLSKRAQYLETSFRRNGVSNDVSDAFELLDENGLAEACVSF